MARTPVKPAPKAVVNAPKAPTRPVATRRAAAAPQIEDDGPEEPETGTALATTKPANVPMIGDVKLSSDLAADLIEDAAAGNDFGRDDLAIPYLMVLQPQSPQVMERADEYIEGAKAGMFYNTVTGQIYDGEAGIVLVPVAYMRSHKAWWPRNSKKGKGLVHDYGQDASILQRCFRDEDTGKSMTPEGHELVVSGDHYVYLVDEGTGEFQSALFAMSSTLLKNSRKWNTLQAQLRAPHPMKPGQTFNPATYYMSYLVTTVPESNEKGNWFNVEINQHEPVIGFPDGETIYRSARDFRKMIDEGKVKVAPAVQSSDDQVGAAAGGAKGTPVEAPGRQPGDAF